MTPDAPYPGLRPFGADDTAAFYARRREVRVLLEQVVSSDITVLYGASGVGKTSVVHAGLLRELERESRPFVVFHEWQRGDDAVEGIKQKIILARPALTDRATATLLELLEDTSAGAEDDLVVVLDQVEELFLYAPRDGALIRELRSVFATRRLPVHLLISIRDDFLSKLDVFGTPSLLQNLVRLQHLTREQAAVAITAPLEAAGMSIEPTLVDAVIDGVRVGSVMVGASRARAFAVDRSQEKVETAFLQLVMVQLWEAEQKVGSKIMRLATLENLGGVDHMVSGYLDRVMARFTDIERDAGARMFNLLVTPGGTKIAHTPEDLAAYLNTDLESVEKVLERLAHERVLRRIQVDEAGERYEVFHDLLAQAVLDWSRRYLDQVSQQRTREEMRREMREVTLAASAARFKHLAIVLAILFLAALAAGAVVAFLQWPSARRATTEAQQATVRPNEETGNTQKAPDQLKAANQNAESDSTAKTQANWRSGPPRRRFSKVPTDDLAADNCALSAGQRVDEEEGDGSGPPGRKPHT